ncbi:MAG: Secretion system C-terminal sorting domain [Bacteroidota bacterium]|jgi:hypothetical protein
MKGGDHSPPFFMTDFSNLYRANLIQIRRLMMKPFFTFLIVGFAVAATKAQMFTPSASALPNGEQDIAYVGQVIDFTVPETASISGEVVEQALAFVYPQTQPVLGLLNLENQSFDLLVERTSLIIQGLPNGVSASCDATPCTYIANASGYITIDGTPTESGQFVINILTLSEGNVDISSITGGLLSSFGLPTSIDLPTPVPSSLDEEGYTMNIADPNGIEESNSVFSLRLYPNPVDAQTTLHLSSKANGQADIEVYSTTGKLVLTENHNVYVGENRLALDMTSMTRGIYLVKVSIHGTQALVRTEKL